MFFVLLWLLQDFLNVLFWGLIQVPGLFLLTLVYRLLSDEDEERLWAIWAAFLGGLLWDLRWVGIPGFFTLGYVAVVMFVLWVWNTLPVQGRTPTVVFMLLESSQLLPPIFPFLVLGGNNMGRGSFVWQQLAALPCVLLCVALYSKRLKDTHV